MNKFILISIFALFCSYSSQAQSTFSVDSKHSSLVFSVGYNYSNFYGSFGEMEGSVVFEDDKKFSSAKVKFTTTISSINTNSEGRDGHLQGERYLNAETNPTASFVSSHIKSIGNNTYEMTGELTIAGKSLAQTVKVEILGQGEVEGKDGKATSIMGIKATFSFNRSNYGVSGGIPTIADKVDIVASLHMVKS